MVSAATKRDQFRPIATRIAIRRGLANGLCTQQEADDLRQMVRVDRWAALAVEMAADRARAEKPGINWGGIIEWIKLHWQDILAILLKILPLFLLSPGPA